MISKQLLLGLSLVFGGGVVLYAMNQNSAPTPAPPAATVNDDVAHPSIQPLTADFNTEERIIAQKQREREARTAAQEKAAKALLEEQERAQQMALAKAQEEAATALTVQTRPKSIEAAKAETAKKEAQAKALAEKKLAEETKKTKQLKAQVDNANASKNTDTEKPKTTNKPKKEEVAKPTQPANTTSQHTVVRGDGLIKLSRQYGVPVSAIAVANNMGRNDSLPVGKTIKIPSQAEVAKLEREAKEQEAQKAAVADADKRLKEARQAAKNSDSKNRYGVQVSLADSQAKADALAQQYKDAGYSVSTSPTSRGVRVLVGSERSQEAANALRDKIRNDNRVNGSGAWVKRIE